jgi:hypothetical protein
MVAKYWVGGTDTWDTTAGSKWASASGGTTYLPIPTTSDTVFFTNLSNINTVTIGTGAVCSTLTMTGFPGTLAFGSNSISAAGTSTFFTGDTTYSVTGTPLIKSTSVSATNRTLAAGAVTETNSISFEFQSGSGVISGTGTNNIRSLTFSGSFSGSLSGAFTPTIYGDLTLISTMTVGTGTGIKTFAGSGTQKITVPSPLNLDFPITFSGTGTYQLQANLAVGTSTTRAITHTSGTIDLQSYTLTHFVTYTSSSSVSSRGFTGTGVYNITRTGTATYWDCNVATGFTRSGSPSVQFTGVNTSASTLTVLHGTTTGAEANAMSFFFGSAPTVNLNGTNPSWIADLGVLPSSSITLSGGAAGRTIYGGFFGGSTTTQSPNPFGPLTFASTSATARNINITSSSYELKFNGVGGSWQLSGTSSAPTVTLTNGTFSTNGNSLTVTTFDFTTTGTRTLNINTTLTINGVGTFKGISTGTTINNTGTISGSGYTVDVPGLNIGNVSASTYIYIGSSLASYTINNLSVSSGGGGFVTLFAASTLNIAGNLSIDGVSGNTNTLKSSTSGTRAYISKSSGTIITNNLNIIDSNATGGATWRAPTNPPYNNNDGGNNLGWDFNPLTSGGNFFLFF